MKTFLVVCLAALAAIGGEHGAAAVTLDFETLADLEPVTSQFDGLTFANTTALVSGEAGGSLNELDFPPRSGVTVVSDDSGPITITFDTLIAEISGFFTYAVPLTITAFDELAAPVASVTSALDTNAGIAPNELLDLAFAGGIASLTLEGDPTGFSFTLDDFSFVALQPVAPAPGPASLVLVGAGLGALAAWRARRGGRSRHRRFAALR